MKTIYIFLLSACCAIPLSYAQEAVVHGRFQNTVVTDQDSIIMISSLGTPYSFSILQDDVLITSAPLIFEIAEDTTSTAFPESISGISVFPNPIRDFLFLLRETSDEALDIELYTMDGRQVMQHTWPSGVKTFQSSLSSVVQGTYVLIVTDERRVKGNQYKIIRQ